MFEFRSDRVAHLLELKNSMFVAIEIIVNINRKRYNLTNLPNQGFLFLEMWALNCKYTDKFG